MRSHQALWVGRDRRYIWRRARQNPYRFSRLPGLRRPGRSPRPVAIPDEALRPVRRPRRGDAGSSAATTGEAEGEGAGASLAKAKGALCESVLAGTERAQGVRELKRRCLPRAVCQAARSVRGQPSQGQRQCPLEDKASRLKLIHASPPAPQRTNRRTMINTMINATRNPPTSTNRDKLSSCIAAFIARQRSFGYPDICVC